MVNRARFALVLQLGCLLGVIFTPYLEGREVFPRGPAFAAGLALEVIGLCLALWARWAMGRSFTIFAIPRARARLVTEGPFRFVRNPIYLASLLMSFGWALIFMSPAAAVFALLLLATLQFKMRVEERALRDRFGGAYHEYCARTPRLWPFWC